MYFDWRAVREAARDALIVTVATALTVGGVIGTIAFVAAGEIVSACLMLTVLCFVVSFIVILDRY